MVLSHVGVGVCAQGGRLAIASMEMSPASLLRRMFQQIGAVELPAERELQRINAWINDKVWIIAVRGTTKTARILELCEYCWRRFNVNQVVIDSLAKCGLAEDDYNGQKSFVDQLADFAARSGCHVHLVCHSRKAENESGVPGKMDVKGTGAITDMVDNVVAVWRNKPKEETIAKAEIEKREVSKDVLGKPDCMLQVHKQRNHDWERKIALWFDVRTHQYLSAPDHRPMEYVK
jgi:twinkle protein